MTEDEDPDDWTWPHVSLRHRVKRWISAQAKNAKLCAVALYELDRGPVRIVPAYGLGHYRVMAGMIRDMERSILFGKDRIDAVWWPDLARRKVQP